MPWTVFTPSVDTRTVYVSTSGSDANDGLSSSTPKQTIAAGKALIRQGMPDWLLLKSGDTFSDSISSWATSGRSASEPQLISAYGTGARPIVSPGGGTGFSPQNSVTNRLDYFAIAGLHFRGRVGAPTATPAGISIGITGSDILVEDCLLERFQTSIGVDPAGQGYFDFTVVNASTDTLGVSVSTYPDGHRFPNLTPVRVKSPGTTGLIHDWVYYAVVVSSHQFRLSTTPDGLGIVDIAASGGTHQVRGLINNVTVRRCTLQKNYALPGDPTNSHGLYSSEGYNWLCEENTFYHCGWLSSGDPIGTSRDATVFDHCIYFLSSCLNTRTINNYFIDPATTGLSGRIGGDVIGNVCIRCPIALLSICEIGYFNDYTNVRGNLIMEGRNMASASGGPTPGSRGWGIQVHGHRLRAEIVDNLIVNVDQGSQAFGIEVNSSSSWRYNATPLCDYVITDNIIVDWPTSITFQPSGDEWVTHPAYPGGPSSVIGTLPPSRNFNSLLLERNVVQGSGSPLLQHAPSTFPGDPTSTSAAQLARTDGADNQIWSPGTANTVAIAGQGSVTVASWGSQVGDSTSAATQVVFPDPTRTVGTYNGTLGGTATHDAFVSELLLQSKQNWRTEYEASVVNNWIRAGFGTSLIAASAGGSAVSSFGAPSATAAPGSPTPIVVTVSGVAAAITVRAPASVTAAAGALASAVAAVVGQMEVSTLDDPGSVIANPHARANATLSTDIAVGVPDGQADVAIVSGAETPAVGAFVAPTASASTLGGGDLAAPVTVFRFSAPLATALVGVVVPEPETPQQHTHTEQRDRRRRPWRRPPTNVRPTRTIAP